tara:strand:- start:48 stop:188 length:141 start_codon:yes stop_codon:yes gene_type:complete
MADKKKNKKSWAKLLIGGLKNRLLKSKGDPIGVKRTADIEKLIREM